MFGGGGDYCYSNNHCFENKFLQNKDFHCFSIHILNFDIYRGIRLLGFLLTLYTLQIIECWLLNILKNNEHFRFINNKVDSLITKIIY